MPNPGTLLLLTLAQALAASPPPIPPDPASALTPYDLARMGEWMDTSNQQRMVKALALDHVPYIRTRYQDRLTFLIVEHEPDFHIRIGLKGHALEPDLFLPVAGTTFRVRVEVGYPYTEAEFNALVEKATPHIYTLIPDFTGVSSDAELGLIEIDVEGTNAQNYQHALAQIESLSGLKAKVRLGMPRQRNLI